MAKTSGETPRFGRTRAPIKGQRRSGLERQLPPAIPKKLPEAVARRRRLVAVKRQESERTDWEEFVFNEGTRDEVRRLGRHYELAEDATSLGLFDIPPRTGRATRLGSVNGGDIVFVIKDSEKSNNSRRRGWAEVVILEKTQEGEKPIIRKFNDGNIRRVVCSALYQGIIDRQVLKPK
jgi:hypothetical protein